MPCLPALSRCFFKCLGFSFSLLFFLIVFAQSAVFAGPGLVLSERLSPQELALVTRLRGAGFKDKHQVYLRLFKHERALEVWLKSGSGYKLFRRYDICKYSGVLGPKLLEGDGQAPEGFYHVPVEDLLWQSTKWPEALNLNFPNVFDAQQGRTGSYLLIHGGCSSKGCFALENGPMSELFAQVKLAARAGQTIFPIHIFPFRFGEKNWAMFNKHRWSGFWKSLQPAYDYFNKHRLLPGLTVCASGYNVLQYRHMQHNERAVLGACITPLPLMSLSGKELAKLDWVDALKKRYKTARFRRARAAGGAPKIKVLCNLKRPSCRKWLALKRKRLARQGR